MSPFDSRRLTSRRGFLKRTAASAALYAGAAGPLRRLRASQLEPTPLEPDLTVHERHPHNAEPSLDRLLRSPVTPLESFYIRSHGPENPQIDLETYRLSVTGMVERPLELTLAEIQDAYPKHTSTVTLTCAGNRRQEFNAIRPVGGVQWRSGAIGNAEWSGARLADLLRRAGVREGAKHVWFDGLDSIPHKGETIQFGGSIPLDKAMEGEAGSTLVCYEMNGKPLSADHGFPLRTVVPGYIGARSVKWLGRIVVSDRPSPNHYVAEAYKLITEETQEQYDANDPIYATVLNSVLHVPGGDTAAPGLVRVQGYALAPGEPGRTIASVEVSADEGRTWTVGRFSTPARPYQWRLWDAKVKLDAGSHVLLCRARDSAGNVQPQQVEWNLKGYLYNAWSKHPLRVG